MNTELFIARRIVSDKENVQSFSRKIIQIAIAGIALGMIIMILAVAIVTGFKAEIWQKVIGFGSHITIVNHDTNSSFETKPIDKDQSFITDLLAIDGIKHIQTYAQKLGIIKTEDSFQGILLKGIGSDFDWSFFEKNLIEGTKFKANQKEKFIVISENTASELKLKVNDKVTIYFENNPPRVYKFTVSGIFRTDLEDFDKLFALVDIKYIQKLYNWKDDQISGFEVLIDDFNELDAMYNLVYNIAGFNFDENGNKLKVQSIREMYPQILDWLELSNINAIIILIFILIVSGFNMVSGLLILILERSRMIGILKALGSRNWNIRKIFLYNSAYLIGKGLLWGNVIGISLCLIQKYFGIIKLDPINYYMSEVPINLDFFPLLGVNLLSLIIILLFLLIPSFVASKINPIKAIRYE